MSIFILQLKQLQGEIVQAEYEHRRLDNYNYKVFTEKETKVCWLDIFFISLYFNHPTILNTTIAVHILEQYD